MTAKELLEKSQSYEEKDFIDDFQSMIDHYDKLSPLGIEQIRDEIYNWDFQIDQEVLKEFDEICAMYARFVAYTNRISFILDKINTHFKTLEFIIKNVKEIASQFFKGTAKEKDSKTSTMLLEINLKYNEIHSLKIFADNIKETLEFNAQQLARILREREAMSRIDGSMQRTGNSANLGRKNTEIPARKINNR